MGKMTLVVLAAGMGSRFGERIKQLEPLGPHGELLIDYSVYDAVKAGFERVVFIIRKDIEELFKSMIGNRIASKIETEYVYQELNYLPIRSNDFPERKKPWGTAQALYCCNDVLGGSPYAVINADDFYGRDAFMRLSGFLRNPNAGACSVGFMLKNTLSDYGEVNRGICGVNDDGLLYKVEETKGIGRRSDGKITGTYNGEVKTLDEYFVASMSMWGFNPDFMPRLERQLTIFLSSLENNDPKSELTIADAVGKEITNESFTVRNISTDSVWFGITYENDVVSAREMLRKGIESGVYNTPLWNR